MAEIARAEAMAGQLRDKVDIAGESWAERNLLNPLAGLLGFNQRFDFSNPLRHTASWSFDPVGGIAGALVMPAGPAVSLGVGRLAALASDLLGNPFEIDLGPDVLSALSLGPGARVASTQRSGRAEGGSPSILRRRRPGPRSASPLAPAGAPTTPRHAPSWASWEPFFNERPDVAAALAGRPF